MAVGYDILQPNGIVKKTRSEHYDDRVNLVNELLAEWETYIENNWLSPNAKSNAFSPQAKVKGFLSTLGYFLIMGNTDGIVTDFKKVMNRTREIPVSSCAGVLDDAVYSQKHASDQEDRHNDAFIKNHFERADEKASHRLNQSRRSPRKKTMVQTKHDRAKQIERQIGKVEFVRSVVDTEGVFRFGDRKWMIRMEYQPEYLPDDNGNYAMDYVLCAVQNGSYRFFDQDLRQITKNILEILER